MLPDIEINCLYCNKPFRKKVYSHIKFCSHKCYHANRVKVGNVPKICPNCGKAFFVIKSKDKEITYCSRACLKKSRLLSTYDLSFLYTDNIFRSWFLGWIMTDGHVTKMGDVNLKITDREIIDTIVKYTNYKNTISECVRENKQMHYGLKPQYGVSFSKDIRQKIVEFGFPLGSKLAKEFIPDCVSDTTFSHFIRGVMEGDGSLPINKSGYLSLYLCSASSFFLRAIITRLTNLGIIYGSPNVYRKSKGTYFINFGHEDSLRICKFMYENSEGMRLTRKYDKYILALDKKIINHQQPKKCYIEGCIDVAKSHNMCEKHYHQWYYMQNKERIKLNKHNYYLENKEYLVETNKKWASLHPETAKLIKHRYKIRMRNKKLTKLA